MDLTLKHAMEQFDQAEHSPMHVTHEYPDPDYAAHVTKYPWREDNGYLPSALHGSPPETLKESLWAGKYGISRRAGDEESEIPDRDTQGPSRDVTWDPDYHVSDAAVT